MAKYQGTIHYTSYRIVEVEAENEEQAHNLIIEEANKNLSHNEEGEIIDNAEWVCVDVDEI